MLLIYTDRFFLIFVLVDCRRNMSTKIAKLVRRNVTPIFAHDCNMCRFLGRLNGEDLYVCRGEYICRFGNEEPDYSTLGDLTPVGTPYAFAKELARRSLPPAEYTA
jgi:hypothetical protein